MNCLAAIKQSQHQLVHIYTQPAQKAGRGKKLTPTDVALWADENKIGCTESVNVNTPQSIEILKSFNADLLVVIAFGQKISNEVINIFPKSAINVHASLLPKYRGAAPINWAIINGEHQTGVSIITLADRMDAGEVLGQASININPNDTADIVHDKLAEISAPLIIDVINQIEAGTAVYAKQNDSNATKAPKFQKSDGYIDWRLPADQIRNKIRGMWPWPGVQAVYVSGQTGKTFRATIASAEVVKKQDGKSWQSPGTLDENMNVICGQDCLKIIKLKPSGGNVMDFASFANGRAAKPGDIFMPIEQIQ